MRLGAAFVAIAAFCWGLSGGIGGILMAEGWDPFVVSFYRGSIGLVFVAVWLAARPRGGGLASGRLWAWSAIAGLGVAGNFSFYFVSIANGSVAVAATLMYCAPVFVFLLSFALKLERPTALKWGSIAMVMLGIVLLTRIHDVSGGASLIAVGAGLLSGLSYALFIFGFKYAAQHGSPQAILVIAFAALAAILILPSNTEQLVAVPTAPSWPLFATLGVLGAGVSFLFYIVGLRQTEPAAASIVAMVEPVTAALFGVLALNENLVASQIVGMALILVTVTTLSLRTNAPPKSID